MRKKTYLFIGMILSAFCSLHAQSIHPERNGVNNIDENYYAFTHVTLHKSSSQIIKDATLLIHKGKVVSSGQRISLPKNTVIYNLKGKHIYPSFIDLFSTYGVKIPIKKEKHDKRPQLKSSKKGPYHWNEAITPEIQTFDLIAPDEKSASKLRKMGFGTVLSHYNNGIISGSGTLIFLTKDSEALSNITDISEKILDPKASLHLSFQKGTSKQNYPNSLMGTIALIRQTYYDAAWYQRSKPEYYNASLSSLNSLLGKLQVFEVKDRQDVLRALKIGKEFDYSYAIKGSGEEYAWAHEIKKFKNARLILPLNFPKPFDIKNTSALRSIELESMRNWESAPYNPLIIAGHNIPFTFTSHGLKTPKDFLRNIKKSVWLGLDKKIAMKALTEIPAKWLGRERDLGKLEKGFWANFIITDGNFFDKKTQLLENWIQGKRSEKMKIVPKINAKYKLSAFDKTYFLNISTKANKPSLKVSYITGKGNDTIKIKNASIFLTQESLNAKFYSDKTQQDLIYFSSSFLVNDTKEKIIGTLRSTKGQKSIMASAVVINSDKKKRKRNDRRLREVPKIYFPNKAYGNASEAKAENILIRNATVWTNEKQGILKNTDVLVIGGKINRIGKNLKIGALKVKSIDGTDKHLTSGIIDEHSHIAISRGVNEATHNTSAEVRIGDVINAEDINIYRQLAGGVTAAQLLHGSANPIGGQSALIKLRWGSAPEEMKIKNADRFIKFALGENVKQSNWGDNQTVRFPQTRMGVEQVYVNAFTQAKEYEAKWKAYQKKKRKKEKPRRDLRLEALAQIINGGRFITCHSYVQSEINMLMHIAKSFGFKINTFTHILEGYKVADKMKRHGVGGSTFSDWWAYKYEVIDAIPYNAAVMHDAGVTVAINSDDAEMGRRLNQEAAKAVKYGGISQEEAWKMVTLNPAKLLHLDNRMGSVREGKDADLVIWNGPPLSVYAKAEKTIIDGIIYFDVEKDNVMREKVQKEKLKIAQKMYLDQHKEGGVRKYIQKKKINYTCND